MSRLIDADKLIKDVLDLPNCENGFSDTYDKSTIIAYIDEQPTVDAEPVKRGKWEYVDAPVFGNPYGSYKCDCGNYMPHKTNYCPNCGAKMDEVKE